MGTLQAPALIPSTNACMVTITIGGWPLFGTTYELLCVETSKHDR
jgi:hypothetical protein